MTIWDKWLQHLENIINKKQREELLINDCFVHWHFCAYICIFGLFKNSNLFFKEQML